MTSDTDVIGSFIPSLHKPSSLLPIARHRQSLLYLIETFPVTIVVGQTGSGKTTQIPQFLEQAGVSENRERASNIRRTGNERLARLATWMVSATVIALTNLLVTRKTVLV